MQLTSRVIPVAVHATFCLHNISECLMCSPLCHFDQLGWSNFIYLSPTHMFLPQNSVGNLSGGILCCFGFIKHHSALDCLTYFLVDWAASLIILFLLKKPSEVTVQGTGWVTARLSLQAFYTNMLFAVNIKHKYKVNLVQVVQLLDNGWSLCLLSLIL